MQSVDNKILTKIKRMQGESLSFVNKDTLSC